MARQDYYIVNDDSAIAISTTEWYGQLFTANQEYTALSVKLLLYKGGGAGPGTVTVSLYAVDGSNDPTGAAIASGTTNGDTLTTNTAGEWREITFASGVSLSNAVEYAFVIVASGVGAVNWRRDVSSPTYAGGNIIYSGDGGSNWSQLTAQDSMFEVWGDTITYSELSGTITGVSTVSGNLGSTTVGLDPTATVYTKRLIVAGNNQIQYEDI